LVFLAGAWFVCGIAEAGRGANDASIDWGALVPAGFGPWAAPPRCTPLLAPRRWRGGRFAAAGVGVDASVEAMILKDPWNSMVTEGAVTKLEVDAVAAVDNGILMWKKRAVSQIR